MNRFALSLAFIAILLSSCGRQADEYLSTAEEQSLTPDPLVQTVDATDGEELSDDFIIPDVVVDTERPRVVQSPYDESHFPLFAMLEEHDIYLYGINLFTSGGMILYQNGKGTYFDWPQLTQRFVLPTLLYHDIDGDGKDDLAVTIYFGAGTGSSRMDLIILKIEEDPNGWRAPTYTEYVLSADNVDEWMTTPITATLSEDGEMYEVEICGVRYVTQFKRWNTETLAEDIIKGVAFGRVVHFKFVGNEIWVQIDVGTYTVAISNVNYFGTIRAQVVFDGEEFSLENYSFYLYD